MAALLVIGIALLLALAIFMAGAAWRLLRDDRERSAARVAALDELAAQEPDDRIETIRPARRLSDREHDERLEDEWDFEIRPEAGAAPAPVPPPTAAPRESPRPVPVQARQPARPPVDRAPLFDAIDPRPAADAVAVAGLFGATTRAPAGRTRGQLATAALTALVVIGVGSGIVYAVRHADAIAGLGRRIVAPAASTTPLELISLRHSENAGRAFSVTGFVQNPAAGGAVRNVVAVVYLFDADGQYFASGRAPLDVKALAPGDESPFVVTIPNVSGVSRYRVGFRTDEGDVVAHVDRRGTSPAGTTGDVINGVDRNPEPPSTPRRVEG